MTTKKSKKIRIMVILGTRPEATKLAPVVLELRRFPQRFQVEIIATGQHRQMLPEALAIFGLKPDISLNIMRPNQSLEHVTSASLARLKEVFECRRADLALVEGDTTTVFAAALAAFYHHVPVAHLEAGLRTDDIYNPFPEEANRRLCSVLTSLHLAPTPAAKDNLLAEGCDPSSIYITGNTAIDAVLWCASRPSPPLPAALNKAKRALLVTAHRRENWGEPLRRICKALLEIIRVFPEVEIFFPVHPNPIVREIANKVLAKKPGIHLLKPMDYLTFVHMMKASDIILSDSGGVQEEAPSLNKPVLVLRENTERPEGLAAGTSRLVGTDPKKIIAETGRLLRSDKVYARMAEAPNPFGDGRAAKRARQAILHYLGVSERRPEEFRPVSEKK